MSDVLAPLNARPELRQVSRPCPKCGSYYRRGIACNICGTPQNSWEIMREQIEREQTAERGDMPRQFSRHGKYHTMQKIIRY